MGKYTSLAQDIIKHIGGADNVASLTNCHTRLRFKLKDNSKADTETINRLKGVITVREAGGQYQIVIGNHVADVCEEIFAVANFKFADNKTAEESVNKGGAFAKFVDTISGIFGPILGVLTATGITKGLMTLFATLGWIETTSGIYTLLNVIGNAVLYYFPVLLGFTAARKFKLNEFTGLIIGLCLCHPYTSGFTSGEVMFSIFEGTFLASDIKTTLLGIPLISVTYTQTVLPVIGAVWFGAKVEKLMKKIMPSVLARFLVPMFTILITMFCTFLLVGPVINWIGLALSTVVTSIISWNKVLSYVVLGGLWQVLVMFGVHWAITPMGNINVTTLGYDTVLVATTGVAMATSGVLAAMLVRTKNKEFRGNVFGAFVSSMFGISEPAIYGYTLPRKTPFFCTLAAGACGGLVMGLLGAIRYNVGGLGLFGIPNFINPVDGFDTGFYGYLAGLATAWVCGFIFSFITYKNLEGDGEETPATEEKTEKKLLKANILAPIKGKVISLSEVTDEAFKSGALGQGVAIIPEVGEVLAPFDGVVNMVFETKHAIGLTSNDGVEMLIHIGVDTVELKGDGFEAFVKTGDKIKTGQKLMSFDMDKISKAGYSLETPVLIVNTNIVTDIEAQDICQVNTGALLLTATV